LIVTLSGRQVLALSRVAANMRPPEMLTPDETVQVDQALKKIEAGHFVDWPDLKVL